MHLGIPIRAEDFRTLNRCLDDAIASSVTEHARQSELALRNDEVARGTERLGLLAHELRNLTNTALLAFEVLKTASVGVDGSTSAILGRNLLRLRDLIGRSLVEVRLKDGVDHVERIQMAGFLREVAAAATLEAQSRGAHLTLIPGDGAVEVEADRQILASVVGNLLQNAIKFTRPQGNVVLRHGATADRVFVEIEDECGGLSAAQLKSLFRAYEQKGSDRSGLGLGLTISQNGARAFGGEIQVRNLPGTGCIFIANLPRALAAPERLVESVEAPSA